MELFEENMKMMENSMSKKLEKMNEIEKETETFTETMLDEQLQIQMQINDSYQEIIDTFKDQSHNETKVQRLSDGQKVIFDGIWTNVGNGYKPSTGIFKAPHPGLYQFTAVLMSNNGVVMNVYLCRNRLRIATSYLTGDGYNTGTFDVVLTLQKGDKVHIKSSTSESIYSDSSKYITFSGYRIP
ncbi:complement C1q-like protein 3 [Mytilus galloprovincialis]|uniref:complement C1q-like protein 3 n=1 Tax=Mytilus galloprovincialis TaxID=29158 RepID=UPI003F7BBC5F